MSAPSAQQLEEALVDGAYRVFLATPDVTSVNKVRRHVEQKLGLDADFFLGNDWKQKSKSLIKDTVDKLFNGWTPDSAGKAASDESQQRQTSNRVGRADVKRRKRSPQASAQTRKESGQSNKSEPESKPNVKSLARSPDLGAVEVAGQHGTFKHSSSPNTKRKYAEKTESTDGENKASRPGKLKTEQLPGSKVGVGQGSSEDEKSSTNFKTDPDGLTKPLATAGAVKPEYDDEEEYSDVIDEPRQVKTKKTSVKKDRHLQSAKPALKKSSASTTSTAGNPEEAEIKKLQSQLIKCGVRRLWRNELAKYGNDSRAKIRHLKTMLADVGMAGRFSESKAREIKEARELMAEAAAAEEMNRLWGMDNVGRSSRSRARPASAKVEESDESGTPDVGDVVRLKDEDDDEEEEEEGASFAARRRRAQADLAFLGDDDDESSD